MKSFDKILTEGQDIDPEQFVKDTIPVSEIAKDLAENLEMYLEDFEFAPSGVYASEAWREQARQYAISEILEFTRVIFKYNRSRS